MFRASGLGFCSGGWVRAGGRDLARASGRGWACGGSRPAPAAGFGNHPWRFRQFGLLLGGSKGGLGKTFIQIQQAKHVGDIDVEICLCVAGTWLGALSVNIVEQVGGRQGGRRSWLATHKCHTATPPPTTRINFPTAARNRTPNRHRTPPLHLVSPQSTHFT